MSYQNRNMSNQNGDLAKSPFKKKKKNLFVALYPFKHTCCKF